MKTPEATATAAAGVAIFSAHDSISSNPFVNFVTNFGVAANEMLLKQKVNTKDNRNIKVNNFLIKTPPVIIILKSKVAIVIFEALIFYHHQTKM